LFNHTANAVVINFIYNPLNERLFCFLWAKLLYGKSALEIAERESSTAGTVASIEIVMDRPAFNTADKSFGVTH